MTALWFTLVTWVFAQLSAGSPQQSLVSALGAIIGPSGGPSSPCGGCYVIADVTGVVFGTEVIYQTVGTQINSVATGRNGSVTTFTSFVEDITPFTFGPNGLSGTTAPAGPITIGVDSSIAIISGLTFTSPTAYNIFTAYSLTSTVLVNGACSVVSGLPIPVNPPLSYPVPQGAARADFALSAEQAFISKVGLPTCSAGGENPVQQTIHPVANITATMTTYGVLSFTPQPIVISTNGVASTVTSIAASPANTPIASILPTVSSRSLPTSVLSPSSSSSSSPTSPSSSPVSRSSSTSPISSSFSTSSVTFSPPSSNPVASSSFSSNSAISSTFSSSPSEPIRSQPSSSPSSSALQASTLGPRPVVSATPRTATAVQTVVIVANSSTTTATISSVIPVVIAANSTFLLPSALGPNVTIIPFAIGGGTTLKGDSGSSWALWGSGVLGIILVTWIL